MFSWGISVSSVQLGKTIGFYELKDSSQSRHTDTDTGTGYFQGRKEGRKEGQGKKVKKTGSGGLLVAPAPGVPRSRPPVSSASPDSACSSPRCPGGTARPPAYPLSPGASGPGWSSRSSATRTGWARYVTTSWLRQESKMLFC